jgi:hypothetical protein
MGTKKEEKPATDERAAICHEVFLSSPHSLSAQNDHMGTKPVPHQLSE